MNDVTYNQNFVRVPLMRWPIFAIWEHLTF